jgi:cytochrome c-type biogenesis protein CcmH
MVSVPIFLIIFVLLPVAPLWAQEPTPLVDPEVRRIGEQLRCMCGACNYTVTSCNMLSCSGAEYGRAKLKALVDQGLDEEAIKAAFVAEFGTVVLTQPPTEGFSLVGWVMPFVAIGFGLAFIWWFVKRYLGGPAPVPAVESELLDRYKDQIEKDLSKIE